MKLGHTRVYSPRFSDLEPGDVVVVHRKQGVAEVPVQAATHQAVVLTNGERYGLKDGERLPRLTWAQRCDVAQDYGLKIGLSDKLRKAFNEEVERRHAATVAVQDFGRNVSHSNFTTDEIVKVAAVIREVYDALLERSLANKSVADKKERAK